MRTQTTPTPYFSLEPTSFVFHRIESKRNFIIEVELRAYNYVHFLYYMFSAFEINILIFHV